jgi:hypothetical protein
MSEKARIHRTGELKDGTRPLPGARRQLWVGSLSYQREDGEVDHVVAFHFLDSFPSFCFFYHQFLFLISYFLHSSHLFVFVSLTYRFCLP